MATYSSSPTVEYVEFSKEYRSPGNNEANNNHVFVSSVPANTTYELCFAHLAVESGIANLTIEVKRNALTSELPNVSATPNFGTNTGGNNINQPNLFTMATLSAGGSAATNSKSTAYYNSLEAQQIIDSNTGVSSARYNMAYVNMQINIHLQTFDVEYSGGHEDVGYYLLFKKVTYP